MRTFLKFFCALACIAAVTACSNVSHKVAADGSGAEQLVWPAPDSVVSLRKGGTFPNVSDLRLIKAGMSKSQIVQLIGTPHFNEGVWGVHEWNYLFNFRAEGSDAVTQCQYKILFDQHRLARSFYWQPESCAVLLEEKKVASAAAAENEQVFTLRTDTLFDFDKSALNDIKDDGKQQLDALATQITEADDHVHAIHIVGYTDRLGGDIYNDALSERRAYTVMHYLVQHGVPSELMTAEGHGKDNAVKECDDAQRAALIACLAPNRRVEVRVQGTK